MTEPIQVPSAGEPESICPSCGKTDKLLWPDGCKNTWHMEEGGAMSEPVKMNFACPFCHAHESFHDQGQFDMIVRHMAAHAEKMPASALRERDLRIEALEKAIKNLLNWYSHEMPQWESGTQKAMDDAEKLLEAK